MKWNEIKLNSDMYNIWQNVLFFNERTILSFKDCLYIGIYQYLAHIGKWNTLGRYDVGSEERQNYGRNVHNDVLARYARQGDLELW